MTGREGPDWTPLLLRVERAGDEGLLILSFSFVEPLEFTLATRDRLILATGEAGETELRTSSTALLPFPLVLAGVRLDEVSLNYVY